MTRRLTLIRQVNELVTFVIHLPYQIRVYKSSVKYRNTYGSCTWSSYQLFALFVWDGDRQSVGLSKLEDRIVTYLDTASLCYERGKDDILLFRDSTMF